MRTSYSALDTFKTCPLKYKYQEIDKIRVPKSKEAVFGTVIHGALKFMFKRNPLFPSLNEVINFFSEKWQEQKKGKIEWSEEEQDVYYQDGLDLLKKFYAKNQPWNFNVVDLESRFETPLETHILTGIIDRIDKPDEDTYEIIDYKTARRMPSQETLDRDLQMSIYHLGLIHRWPHLENRKIKLSLYFLKHGEKISTIRDEQSLQETKRFVLGIIGEIEKRSEKKDFSPLPGPLCDWCGYRKICPMWMHLFSNFSAEGGSASGGKSQKDLEPVIEEYFNLKKDAEEKSGRLKILQGVVHEFMNNNKVERIFGKEGFITRTIKKQPVYEIKKGKIIGEKETKILTITRKKF